MKKIKSKKFLNKLIFVFFALGFFLYSLTEPLYTPTAIETPAHHYLFPKIIAHKGRLSEKCPGNTLSAIEETLASTIEGIEVDVRLSKDGVLFLYHGDTLEELTTHSGVPEQYAWDVLSSVYYTNTHDGLVRLDDFLKRVGTQKVIFLDIKSPHIFDYAMVKKLADLIKKHNLQENIFVESFNPFTLFLMRWYMRDIMLVYDFVDDANALGEESQSQFDRIPWILKQHWVQKQMRRILRPDVLGPRFNVNCCVFQKLVHHGYPIISWTVDDPKWAQCLYDRGVKGVQTNKPQLLERYCQKKKTVRDAGGTEAKVDKIVCIYTVDDLFKALEQAKKDGQCLICAGRRHSMGGHALLDKGLFLNMLPLSGVSYDEASKTVTAQAGATWKKVQETLAPYGRSIKVMQSDTIFTVGGSISVNVHGWQVRSAPISSTIISLTVITPDGKLRKISPTEEPELFKAVVGGYGMFAIIVEAQLTTVPNALLKFQSAFMPAKDLIKHFKEKVTDNKKAELGYARLSTDQKNLFEEAGLFWYETQESVSQLPLTQERLIALKRGIFKSSEYGNFGKKLRWSAEKLYASLLRSEDSFFSRNDAMNSDIHILWPLYGTNQDILHEYFIPKKNLYHFILKLKKHIEHYRMNVLNVTIREVLKDTLSSLPYAKDDMFGVVCLFSQERTEKDEEIMKVFTQAVVTQALDLGGTFYLPYKLHFTHDQILRAYPEIKNWMHLKKSYDPTFLLQSQFFHYLIELGF